MASLNCCAAAQRASDPYKWLSPISEIVQLHSRHLQLFRCPSCGQFWVGEAVLVGHRDWDYSFRQSQDEASFQRLVAQRRTDDEVEIEELKKKYEEHGLDWRTGRKKK